MRISLGWRFMSSHTRCTVRASHQALVADAVRFHGTCHAGCLEMCTAGGGRCINWAAEGQLRCGRDSDIAPSRDPSWFRECDHWARGHSRRVNNSWGGTWSSQTAAPSKAWERRSACATPGAAAMRRAAGSAKRAASARAACAAAALSVPWRRANAASSTTRSAPSPPPVAAHLLIAVKTRDCPSMCFTPHQHVPMS